MQNWSRRMWVAAAWPQLQSGRATFAVRNGWKNVGSMV
jgi:hypothetical protein